MVNSSPVLSTVLEFGISSFLRSKNLPPLEKFINIILNELMLTFTTELYFCWAQMFYFGKRSKVYLANQP